MNYKEQVANALSSLKDFQKATVDFVVKQITNGQKKFLIADEVGLGKTIVAKGIIAKLYEESYSPRKDFRVIYICSNQALAKQNLSKLNFIKPQPDDDGRYVDDVIEYNYNDDRLTSLAYEPTKEKSEYHLKIKALTPATSFDNKTKAGKSDERVLLFRLLMDAPGMKDRRTSLKWFLKGGGQIGAKNWGIKTDDAINFELGRGENVANLRPIRKEIYSKFRKTLKSRISDINQKKIFGDIKEARNLLQGLHYILEQRKQNRSFEKEKDRDIFKDCYGLIAELRLHLSYVCKDYLKADLFILDEFQKFSQLIKQEETENKGEEIARAVFSDPDAKVLLLSATPFKVYTNSFDEYHGENHYQEFKTVLQFLYPNKPEEFWEKLEEDNNLFFNGIKNFGSPDGDDIQLISLKENIEKVYRQCLSRTERTLVERPSDDNTKSSVVNLEIKPDDVRDFIAIDEIIIESNKLDSDKLSHPVEYVKSAPFPLSFLQDYDHHKVLKKNYGDNVQLQRLIKKSKNAFVPVDKINSYKPLLPERSIVEPNPKLRLLYDETVRNNGYRLLWIPPSLKYYQPKSGAYINTENFSKALIFSAWKMVPRMVSALVSYEAERLSIGRLLEQEKINEKHSYKDKKRFPAPTLTFRTTETGLSGMNNLMLAYPSIYLKSLYHPVNNLVTKKDLSKIRLELKTRIISDLKNAGILSLGDGSGNVQKWDWLSLLLLDKTHPELSSLKNWLRQNSSSDGAFDNDNETDNKDSDTNKSAKQIHFQEIRNYILNNSISGVGTLKENQLDRLGAHLTELCLGAPGVTAFRAVEKTYKAASVLDHLKASFSIGMGMISMFNKPESIAVVKTSADDNFYYQNVLTYAIEGNIQAMFDEFVYQLEDSGGKYNCLDAAELISNILMVGSSKVDVMTEKSIKDDQHFSMRTHYAVPFGSASNNDLKNGKRQIKVREAFNSPFRPFVLTSTSIGQEGLDFHYYCKKIIHWNLPSNPIDLEQREGRIKRYKSLLVRKNVATLYRERLNSQDLEGKVWDALFNYASKENKEHGAFCELIPYWHLNTRDNQIDSIIPLYRYSKDVSKYKYIKQVLTNYRLSFGQPNQQDLIEAISGLSEGQQNELKKLLIDLCPLNFKE